MPKGHLFLCAFILASLKVDAGKEVTKMADTDFFDKPEEKVDEPKEEEKQEEAKVKVGEKEYTQDELSKLVGLGEIGAEAEEKFNVKLDKVWPNL